MATAKPKTKRMMMGGMSAPVGKALGGVKNAVAAQKGVPAYAQPYVKQMQAAKSAAQQAAPKQMQFMSDKLRGAAAAPKQFMSNALRSGAMKPPSGMMKKGGVVKKATKK